MGLSVRTGLALLCPPGRQAVPPGLPVAWSWVPNATKGFRLDADVFVLRANPRPLHLAWLRA
jgi:hypothetical protein